MDAKTSRGVGAANTRVPAAPSGRVTRGVAEKSLNVSPRTVRWHIERNNLEATFEGEDVRRSWLVSIDSLQALRDSRKLAAHSPRAYRAEAEGADTAADSPGNAIRELADRLVEEASRASEFRVRLELSERAESTLREELEDDRRRREQAERRAEDLERRPQEIQEPQHEAAEASEGSPEPRFDAEGPQAATGDARRPWWRRKFGGRGRTSNGDVRGYDGMRDEHLREDAKQLLRVAYERQVAGGDVGMGVDLPAAAEERGLGHDGAHLAALVDFMEVAGWIEPDPGANPIGRGEVGMPVRRITGRGTEVLREVPG